MKKNILNKMSIRKIMAANNNLISSGILFMKYFFMKYIFLILLSGCRLKCTCLITSH